jgi:hypothetical protein
VHGDGIERDHLGLALGVELLNAPVGAEARGVAQADDRLLRVAHGVDQPLARRGLAEIGRDDEDAHPVLAAQLIGQRLQPIGPARDDHEVVAQAR